MSKNPNCSRMVEISKLYRKDNVRTAECEQIPQMVESIKRWGYKSNHPLVVHEDSDGRYKVLCGNRRTAALEFLAENEPETLAKMVGTKVPAMVYSGLTLEEQIELRIDHGSDEDRIALDEWSTFLAIKQLVQAFGGESQARIAEKLGIFHTKGKHAGEPNRAYVQPRVNLARLPMFIQDEYEKLSRQGKDSTPVRWSNVKTLYQAYNVEFAEFPNGDGPQLAEAWQKVLNPPTKESAESTKDGSKSLSATDAKTRAQSAQSNLVRRVLLASTNQGSIDLATIDAQASAAESAESTLDAIRQYLGESDFATLVAEATAHVAENVAPVDESTDNDSEATDGEATADEATADVN